MAQLRVNGTLHDVEATPGRTLLTALRDDCGLTGTKYGCGEGQCGACTVLVDGTPARACTTAVDAVGGPEVTTIEGLGGEGRLHPVQQAFVDARALQCGYCTPGMVMSAVALLERDPEPDEAAVRQALDGNLCRCGGYPRILAAVRAAASGLSSEHRVPRAVPAGTGGEQLEVSLPPLERGDRSWGWSTPGGARLVVDTDGHVHAYVGKVDGGQGSRWAFTRLVAAELGVPTSCVHLEMGDTATAPFDLGTFGSRSTPDAGHVLRLVAAEARRRLRSNSSASASADPDAPLAASAPGIATVDDDAVRCGLFAAVTGTKRFPSDLTLPGMLHGRVLRSPAQSALLRRADTSAAAAMPGVTVVEEDDFVAVAAADRQAVARALQAIDAEWSPGTGPREADLSQYLRTHPAEDRGWAGPVDDRTGDVDEAATHAAVVVAGTYTAAYIAHVPLEPRSALATVDADTVTVWVGSQRPFGVRSEVAAAVGLPEANVRVVVPDFGGGFGGKHSGDVAIEAVRIARATGFPVKVEWTREEEFRHAYFRPAAVIDVRSSATSDGTITGWDFTNVNSGPAALHAPYDIPNQRVRYQPADSPLRQGSYRALAATANTFARESHVDELATALGVDAVDLRLRHLTDDRLKAALSAVADHVGWPHQPDDPDTGLGIACGVEKGARVATAAEVRVAATGALNVRRVVTAFDCGAVVDRGGLHAQVVGATIMGLGGAMWEAIHFDAGRVHTAGLTDYRVPRFTDIPPIEAILLDRPELESSGAGETPIIAVAPALANAVFAAIGRRVRSLPLAPDGRLRPC
jgi:isoquinoline 1-oxidoreductase